MRLVCRILTAPVLACALASSLSAQDSSELLNRMRAMEERIQALEAEVRSLKAQQSPAPAPPPAPVVQESPPPPDAQLGGAGSAAAKALNPDISVIGDFIGASGNHGGRSIPAIEMHESEIGFQEIIDPYARADFFLTFGEQGVDLEEGYLTFTALPGRLQLRAGKMRAAFGKVNTLHNHALPWVDRPLVTQNLLGGEEGINDAGLSLSRLLPAPKGIFLEGTAQVYRGDSANVFATARRSQLTIVDRLRAYRDLSESTNLDLGVSYARGHSPWADGWNQLWGADATLRWKPLRRSIYRSFVARSELVWARTRAFPDEISGESAPGGTSLIPPVARPFGFFVSGEYQLGRRWFLGGRFDRSQRGRCLPTDPETAPACEFNLNPGAAYSRTLPLVQDTGGSLLLTYWPSEFSQIRGQLRRTRYGEGRTANEFLFQFMFSMGAHGAHPF